MLALKNAALGLCLVLLVTGVVAAQEGTFTDPSVEYSFVLPEAGWKMIVRPSATSPNVEYVFNDRRQGHLELVARIERLHVPAVVQLHVRNARLHHPPREQAALAE